MYKKPSHKYEDLKSSASAFLFVGGVMAVFAILCWFNIINLPMHGGSGLLFKGMMTVMGMGALAGAFFTYRAAKKLEPEIQKDEDSTNDFVQWFLDNYDRDMIDSHIQGEYPGIIGDEMSLKRFEMIQDYLILNNDLPDESYVDALCEDIYQKLYE